MLAAGLMLVLVVATSRRFPAELLERPVRTDQPVPLLGAGRRGGRWHTLLANRMVRLILTYQLLSAAVTLLLDYMVWERAAARFPDPIALAQFQGLFGAVMNFVSVLFVVTLGGWALTRFGIGFGLAANPLGVLVLLCATTVAGYAVGPASLLFFGLVSAQAVTDISLTDATTRTSINATYQALQPDERVRAQTLVEGAGVPLALGFVGVLLIAFDVVGLDITAVVVVTLLLSAMWLVSAGARLPRVRRQPPRRARQESVGPGRAPHRRRGVARRRRPAARERRPARRTCRSRCPRRRGAGRLGPRARAAHRP